MMARGTCTFRLRDAAALVKAVRAAGVEVARVELDNGKIVVVATGKTAAADMPNELDRELQEFEARNAG